MKDINFFSPYIKNDNVLKKRKKIGGIIIIVLFIITMSYSLYINHITNDLTSKQIEYKAYLESPNTKIKLEKINEQKRKLEIMKQYNEIVKVVNSKMNKVDNITSLLIYEIASALPQDVFFKNMSINGLEIELEGASGKRTSIGEFQHNLKSLVIFDEVHVNSIIEDKNDLKTYTFVLKFKIKDGDN